MKTANGEPHLIDKIVCEVKSQGVFDAFRKECMADVDTKPAYQNLRQRVENSVAKFLRDQEWKPDLNKNQLRERLRRNITDASFFDTGVQRIVDQVVNIKIENALLQKIEDISYRYLGIEKPKPIVLNQPPPPPPLPPQPEETLLPVDLEAVSPESVKTHSQSSVHADSADDSIQPEIKDDSVELNESGEPKIEDFESPAFEPLDGLNTSFVIECKKMIAEKMNVDNDDSQLSAISGLTSQDSIESLVSPEKNKSTDDVVRIESIHKDEETNLSQVSSNSRLSIVTTTPDNLIKDIGDLSEEAQTPKFNDSSNSSVKDAATFTPEINDSDEIKMFNITREVVEFQGPLDSLADTMKDCVVSEEKKQSPEEDNSNTSLHDKSDEHLPAAIKESPTNTLDGVNSSFSDPKSRSSPKERRHHSSRHSSSRSHSHSHDKSKYKSSSRHGSSSVSKDPYVSTKSSSSSRHERSHSKSSSRQSSHGHRHKSSSHHKSSSSDKKRSHHYSSSDLKSSRSHSKSKSKSVNDDHSSYRDKPPSRRRSTDSNDGNSNGGPSKKGQSEPDASTSTTNNLSSTSTASTVSSPTSSASNVSQTDSPTKILMAAPSVPPLTYLLNSDMRGLITSIQQPIIIDQILLSGNEINLGQMLTKESFENKTKLIKPKIANNIYEAKRLSKIREEINMMERKLSLINDQLPIYNEDMELEFARIRNNSIDPVPDKIDIPDPVTPDEFYGFSVDELELNSERIKGIEDILIDLKLKRCKPNVSPVPVEFVHQIKQSESIEHQNNNTLSVRDDTIPVSGKKRKGNFGEQLSDDSLDNNPLKTLKSNTETAVHQSVYVKVTTQPVSMLSTSISDLSPNGLKENDYQQNIGSITNSTSNTPDPNNKRTMSANYKAAQRYSSDDLYKPRPILLGSRSRRRGNNATD